MSLVSFEKYHGAGNDFILVDNRNHGFDSSVENVAFLCNRHLGIGADGLMLLENDDDYDFKMRYFNSDGGEASMCGNGGRCITAFAHSLGILTSENVHFLAVDGPHEAQILCFTCDEWFIKLKMIDVEEISSLDKGYFTNTGSPHYVEFVDNLADFPVVEAGRNLRYSRQFKPGGTNVNFVQMIDDRLFVRTYERGVEDETLACGTGVTASSLTYASLNNILEGVIPVRTLGGNLEVAFRKTENRFNNIYLTGPVMKVFKGEINI